jgi:hypothetical protein
MFHPILYRKVVAMARPETQTPEVITSTTTRKIGRCTYIISSNYAPCKQTEIISALARLIQSENHMKSAK